jgi:HTH-type transcriptional regulator/antitoxin HigA
MDIQPIKTEADYVAALQEIEGLMEAAPDTPQGDRLDVLVTLVEAYEAKHYPIAEPDPIAAIVHRMEALGLTMIRKLAKTLHIPADVLIQPYATEDSPAAS